MLSHTVQLREHVGRDLNLSADEAAALAEKGFRFSIYRPGEFRLSLPLQTIEDRLNGTLTIQQPVDT